MSESPTSERYEIRSKIGQGGIGAVYRAWDRSLNRHVAIKRLLPQGEKPEEERHAAEEIVREAGHLSKLQHPNIVTVYDAGIDEDGGFVVMELIEGETIDKTIEKGAIGYQEFLSLAEQALEGLIAAQEIDMLHRDIKPSNVMVHALPSGKHQLKLLDFGLAKVTQKPALQTILHGDAILGSMHFMAPEQFEREALDGRTDLYSLGCLYYYALAGRYAFDGESGGQVMAKKLEHDVVPLSQRCPQVPAPVAAWVMRLMSRRPDDRPFSAKAALHELLAAIESSQGDPQASRASGLLTPAVAGGQAPPVQPSTGPVLSAATPPASTTPASPMLHPATTPVATARPGVAQTTTAYFTNPPAPRKSGQGARAAAVIAVLAVAAGGGWALLGGKGETEPTPPREPAAEAPAPRPDPTPPAPAPSPPGGGPAPTTLVKAGARWHFWDSGLTPGVGWRGIDHPLEDWGQGEAPLGYGDDPKTEISFGGDPQRRHMSYFFRHRFDHDGKSFSRLILRMQVDDGAIIYLNGEEVARLRIEGQPSLSTPAAETAASGAHEERWHEFEIPTSTLREGANIIAARVHQVKADSSDLRFDLELEGY